MTAQKQLKEAQDLIENVRYSSSMLLNLIQDLMDQAKMESMNFWFNDEFFDLTKLLTEAINVVQF